MHHNAFQILIRIQTLLMWFSRTTGDNYWIIDCQWISLYWRTCAWQRIWWYVSTIALLPSKFQIWVFNVSLFLQQDEGMLAKHQTAVRPRSYFLSLSYFISSWYFEALSALKDTLQHHQQIVHLFSNTL